MRYPYGGETRKEKSHDYRRYYPHIFYLVAITMPNIPRHSQAKLYPSELVTIGILFSLKGGYFRAFYRWLQRDYGDWFGDGPS